ncbi:hypothetical protein [Microbacterium deminutum]|uniref:3-carboxymuconate cyclase n=1 Tax=Microbacterium deminutum TaxID=344164 RepID=A0ABN2R6C4_9MICO
MRTMTRAVIAAAAAATLVGFGAGAANAAPPTVQTGRPSVGTVFVQTDAVAGNSIVSYDRLADGSLRQAGVYPTGGLGVSLAGAVVDRLASQSSLVRSGPSLFAVNGGSNTITSFLVVGDRLVRHQVIGSDGQAPVSLAAHDNRVFVLNARAGGSIQGYVNLLGHLVKIPAWHRELGLDPTAVPEFTHTPAQIAFTPDGSKLVVTTKANTSAFDVFSWRRGGLSAQPVVTAVPGAVPFGFQFDPAGHLIASEAGTNSIASFTVNPNGTVTQIAAVATGQAATCWTVVTGGYAFVSNAGSATLSGYRIGPGGSLTAVSVTPTDAGTVDAAVSADGRFLYVQTGAAGLVDEFAINSDGTLTRIGSVSVPNAVGGEGIVAQ